MATSYQWADTYNATLADSTRYRYEQASAEGRARRPYLSHGARFERMIVRYTTARREGRMRAAAAIKRAAQRIVDEMPC
jgi:hypothetical protein